MLVLRPNRSTLARLLTAGLVATAVSVCAPTAANAHFVLQTPAATMSQDGLGSPQKMAPCGDDGTGTPTGMVTTFQVGQTITVTIDEKIFHPGHYRISLGKNGPGDLPAEPIVTPGANTPCGTAPVEATPTFPVLADGVFEHQAPFNGPQTITVTLPPDVTCTNCTLQVLEFMSNHPLNNPGGCYYHHCANIAIESSASTSATSGGMSTTGTGSTGETAAASTSAGSSMSTSSGGAGGAGMGGSSSSGTPGANESSGCGFSGATPAGSAAFGLLGLAALAAFTRRRRFDA